tara:strand:- start:77 stop:352 length:276 start_codon:yes stop_codon:yes gene_type:complete
LHSPQVQSVEHQFIYKEQLKEAEYIVQNFPEKRKMVYELKHHEGLTNRQIAEKMEISTTMVEKHWRNAISTLKDHLQNLSSYTLLAVVMFF